jgi:CRP-like cAMP-binding protein
MEQLLSFLMSIRPMSAELISHLMSVLETKVLHRKELLLKKGRVCNYIYFIESGLLRCYYERHETEVTSWLMTEGNVIISISSFFNQAPSRETIQALEETVLHGISHAQLEYIYERYPEFNYHGRVLNQQYYALCDERLYAIRMQRAYERYQYLMATQPEIFSRVPAKHIASYLGITNETLSRIRAQH